MFVFMFVICSGFEELSRIGTLLRGATALRLVNHFTRFAPAVKKNISGACTTRNLLLSF